MFIFTPEASLSWKELILWVNDYGYDVRLLPYEVWRMDYLGKANNSNALYPFLALYDLPSESQEEPTSELKVQYGNLKNVLKNLDIKFPCVDEKLFEVYFEHFCREGFLSPPSLKKMVV